MSVGPSPTSAQFLCLSLSLVVFDRCNKLEQLHSRRILAFVLANFCVHTISLLCVFLCARSNKSSPPPRLGSLPLPTLSVPGASKLHGIIGIPLPLIVDLPLTTLPYHKYCFSGTLLLTSCDISLVFLYFSHNFFYFF